MPSIDKLLVDAFEDVENKAEAGRYVTGIATGFDDLDWLTAGLQPGHLIVLSGVAGVGKSALALNIGSFVASQLRRRVLYADPIQSPREISTRLIAGAARVDSARIRIGRLEDTDWRKLGDALNSLGGAALEVTGHDLDLEWISTAARELKDLALVIVDGLGMITHTDRGRDEARWDAAARVTRELKRLALELSVPVLVTVGVGRGPQGRKDKRPNLSDLVETSVLEYEADLILALYRDEMYYANSPDAGIAELIALKQRNGPTGYIKLAFVANQHMFYTLG